MEPRSTFKVTLFTVNDLSSGRDDNLNRLLSSLHRQGPNVDIHLYLLLQNANYADRKQIAARIPCGYTLLTVPYLLGASAARNRLLDAAANRIEFGQEEVLAFPDDDCWFPDKFLSRVARIFRDDAEIDVLICRTSETPDADTFSQNDAISATIPHIVRLSSANNIFLRGQVAARIGKFDPELGLGTPTVGGEDTDFAIRASLHSRKTKVIKRLLVGHHPPSTASAAKYYRGSLVSLAKHARQGRMLHKEFFRKLFVGLYFVLSGHLSLRFYCAALAHGSIVYHGPLRIKLGKHN